MKAMILAAGLGTRMLPITKNIPKPLIKVNNKHLIQYSIESLKNAGINNLIINLHHLGEQIKATLGNGKQFDINIKYSDEELLLNTGGGIVNAINKGLLGLNPFIVISSDIITNFNFNLLPKKLSKLAHLILIPNPTYNPHGDFSLDGCMLQSPNSNSNLNFTYANIGIFDPKFFAGSPNGAFPLKMCIDQAIAAQQITAEIYTGTWHNIGTIKDLYSYEQKLL